ncbi:MAG: UDP-N-acetylglucosamine 2-epimerase (non-hydrolyzing) [Chloroflexi bacterium HGW-Chloroflexi-4]|jgi:UDP-N-acetylglucosamine 2-epimerase (non-hydrolysing)|nr:MAG: UDP-N-acetylglucosamine 2-epimerase (non-hydrolyzing) [Chloroflexi bacterium HGW-Chloroflexi-4]
MADLRVLSIFGTRPEAIKMAPVVKALENADGIVSRVCVTAQHREMLDQVLELFKIKPDIDLNLMKPNQSLSQLTAQILENIDPVLSEEKPDWVLIQGDTTTVMAASLAAFYRGIKVGHVEAGLRTNDKLQPFPEEINRRIASVTADLHFAPTQLSRENLLNEGISDDHILVTGNPAIDALQQIVTMPAPAQVEAWLKEWGISNGKRRLVLITAHRRENFGQPIEDICSAISSLASHYGDAVKWVYPVHLNPNIQETVKQRLGSLSEVTLLAPLEYISLVHLMKAAAIILTDSGGIQEEATGLGKPALVLREKTERPEGVAAGVLKLVGTDPKKIISETRHLLDDPKAYDAMAHAENPFGDGHAAGRIVKGLLDYSG